MERSNDTVNNVLLIRKLAKEGFREKVIKMITGLNQSYINKIVNNKLYRDLQFTEGEEVEMSQAQELRLDAAKKILACKEIFTDEPKQEMIYMQLLKFFLIDKQEIFKLYPYMTKTKISRYLLKKDVNILEFNSELIQVPKEVYLDLVIDYFIDK